MNVNVRVNTVAAVVAALLASDFEIGNESG